VARFYQIMDVGGLDVKLGLRLMRKSWGLTLVGGVAMALTIGLGTAIFTLWNTATSTTLPLSDGDRIVAIQPSDAATGQIHRDSSLPDFGRWRELLRSVTDVSAVRQVERTLVTPGGASGPITVAEMTASAFRLARVQPVLGRPLVDDDERGGANVVVIGVELWQAGFSSDRAVLGRQLQLDDVYYTVVGVMPKEFALPVSQRIWIPLRTRPGGFAPPDPPAPSLAGTPAPRSAPAGRACGAPSPVMCNETSTEVSFRAAYRANPSADVFVFARLASGFTVQSAHAEVEALGLAQDRVAQPNEQTPLLRPRVVPYVAGVFTIDASNRWTGGVVLLLATLLLLPPCANIAILVYARAVTRREEFATRYALGATRGRIVLQIFVEALVLAAAAGIIGSLFAREFAVRISRLVLPAMGPENVPFWFDFSPSLNTVLCLAGLVVVAAAIAGGVPGLRVTGRWRSGLHTLGERGTSAGLGRTWTALLATQVAVSIAVLPTATQMLWGLLKPTLSGPGMAVDQYLTGWLVMQGDHSRFGARQSELVDRLRGEAAISGVTLSAFPLMAESGANVEVMEVDGGPERVTGQTAFNRVDRAFFYVFGVRFRAGRQFDATDFGRGQSHAIVVNRTFATEIAGTENALGHRVRYTTPQDPAVSPEPWYEIVGVVEDFPANNHRATVYHPLPQAPVHRVSFTLRVGPDVGLAAARLREATKAIDPALRIGRLRSLGEIYGQWTSVANTLVFMLGSVMLIVLLFAMAGMYTLLAFIVAQRRREVGLRCALGAQPGRLVMGIFGRSLVPLVIGASAGCLVALLIDSSVQVEQAGGQRIPGIVPAAAAVMILMGILALAGPARRAIRIDPAEALRMN
jgi:putative ABC transport system permease protein